jgi:hypothetical protein
VTRPGEKVFVVAFDREDAVLRATEESRRLGLRIRDVYTPYAVHGLDEAMGIRRTRLGLVCFAAGAAGLLAAAALQAWTSAVSWPLNVGGKPAVSVPAFVPVAFEMTVLFAALCTVFALFVRARLFPGRRAWVLPRTTNDRFALVIGLDDLPMDDAGLRAWARRQGAVEFDWVEVPS